MTCLLSAKALVTANIPIECPKNAPCIVQYGKYYKNLKFKIYAKYLKNLPINSSPSYEKQKVYT